MYQVNVNIADILISGPNLDLNILPDAKVIGRNPYGRLKPGNHVCRRCEQFQVVRCEVTYAALGMRSHELMHKGIQTARSRARCCERQDIMDHTVLRLRHDPFHVLAGRCQLACHCCRCYGRKHNDPEYDAHCHDYV